MLADRVILACTVLIAVIYLYATTQIPTLDIGDPLGPKAFPLLLGIALLLAAGLLGLELRRGRATQTDEADAPAPPPFELKIIGVLLIVVFWTGCYYLVFERLGYILATVLYLLPLMAWFNRGKWLANIASALLFTGFTYFLFVKLEVRLPPGPLPF